MPEPDIVFLTDLPGGLDNNEWMASHSQYTILKQRLRYTDGRNQHSYHYYFLFAAIGFFEHINLIYGTVSEFCTATSCPDMTAPGPRWEKRYSAKGPLIYYIVCSKTFQTVFMGGRQREEVQAERAAVHRLHYDIRAEDHQRRNSFPHKAR